MGALGGMLRWLAVLVVVPCWSVAAPAPSLKAEISPLAIRPRQSAPVILDVKLTWLGGGLLEGVLELTAIQGGEPHYRQQLPESTLVPGAQTVRAVLPPIGTYTSSYATDVHLRFLPRNQRPIDLGEFPLSIPSDGSRPAVIAACGARARLGEGETSLWHALRLERLQPEKLARNRQQSTSPVMLEPDDLPSNALTFCAFDMVALEGASLGRLKARQLAALEQWVQAGGSLFIQPGGVLEERHLAFLNRLLKSPELTLDAEGHVAGLSQKPNLRRAGLGHVVIAGQVPQTAPEIDSGEWRRVIAFLWKLPKDLEDAVVETGKYNALNEEPQVSYNQRYTDTDTIRQTMLTLLPTATRLIPLPIVGCILGAFVLLVGPLDWIVLGRWRLRRWTWVLFPITTAACTATMIYAAQAYLGREDHRPTLTITDLGSDGKVCRENRFEMIFTGSHQRVITPLHRAIAIPTNLGYQFSRNDETDDAPPIYRGSFPAEAEMQQQIRQWSPQVNRIFSCESTAVASEIPWDKIYEVMKTSSYVPSSKVGFAEKDWDFYAVHRGQIKPKWARPTDEPVLRTLSIARTDLQSRVTVAPGGGAELGDLTLHDDSDPKEYLLMAIRRTGESLQIYRRLYYADE